MNTSCAFSVSAFTLRQKAEEALLDPYDPSGKSDRCYVVFFIPPRVSASLISVVCLKGLRGSGARGGSTSLPTLSQAKLYDDPNVDPE